MHQRKCSDPVLIPVLLEHLREETHLLDCVVQGLCQDLVEAEYDVAAQILRL